jgi:hypothetical protein
VELDGELEVAVVLHLREHLLHRHAILKIKETVCSFVGFPAVIASDLRGREHALLQRNVVIDVHSVQGVRRIVLLS